MGATLGVVKSLDKGDVFLCIVSFIFVLFHVIPEINRIFAILGQIWPIFEAREISSPLLPLTFVFIYHLLDLFLRLP